MEGRAVTVPDETVTELRRLAAGDSLAAFKSAARACGMTEAEADLVWQVCTGDERDDGDGRGDVPELDARESGVELRSGRGLVDGVRRG